MLKNGNRREKRCRMQKRGAGKGKGREGSGKLREKREEGKDSEDGTREEGDMIKRKGRQVVAGRERKRDKEDVEVEDGKEVQQ